MRLEEREGECMMRRRGTSRAKFARQCSETRGKKLGQIRSEMCLCQVSKAEGCGSPIAAGRRSSIVLCCTERESVEAVDWCLLSMWVDVTAREPSQRSTLEQRTNTHQRSFRAAHRFMSKYASPTGKRDDSNSKAESMQRGVDLPARAFQSLSCPPTTVQGSAGPSQLRFRLSA